MYHEKIYVERIKRFIQRQKAQHYEPLGDLKVFYISDPNPIPHSALDAAKWQEIKLKEIWSKLWGSARFKVEGRLCEAHPAQAQGLYFDCQGEACVMLNGTPYMGLTPKVDWYHNAAKYYVPLAPLALEDGSFTLYIEAAANDLFGASKEEYRLDQCHLARFGEELYQFTLDIELLLDLALALPEKTARREKILYGLNEICNIFAQKPVEAKAIAKELLSKPAHASALKAYSVGHAHLDLAWLWPLRESRRKGGRSFANALRLIERYPSYIFGASQAQLYQWIKEDYPALYAELKAAVKSGQWEVQGASWTEFDTNVPSGESIIRQFYYGQKFFSEEFGIIPNYLWLPDCFGFSANMPQLMKGCGVKLFITQKLSWNETNVFDKHFFIWEGIDGSRVRGHQLPTNDYNFSNNPSAFIATESRFTAAGYADAYLNLFGIGDGGGGPTRNHIEYGLRQKDLEGSARFEFSKAERFFEYFENVPAERMQINYTEMYLELHRGTYTTQGQMKKDNFTSERLLGTAEWLSALSALKSGDYRYPETLHKIWEDTLLLQFHDILPGSSITPVYEDSRAISEKNHQLLKAFIAEKLQLAASEDSFTILNPAPTGHYIWFDFPAKYKGYSAYKDGLQVQIIRERGDKLNILVYMDAFSISRLQFIKDGQSTALAKKDINADSEGTYTLNNGHLKAKISPRGTVLSIRDESREYLAEESNRVQLWEDEPNNWGAWDINHFYRETLPFDPDNVELLEAYSIGDYQCVTQKLSLGKSTLIQSIELHPYSRHLIFRHEVDWQEHHKMLRSAFETNLFNQEVEAGVQMGKLKRSIRPKNSWEAARFDFPAQGYVALRQPDKVCAILSGAKYGFSAYEKSLELALLRSPADVDPSADIGYHSYTYGFFCGSSEEDYIALHQLAHTIDLAPLSFPGKSGLESFAAGISGGGQIISSIKPAYDGSGIVIRLYEALGQNASVLLTGKLNASRIVKSNLIEEPLETLDKADEITFKPFEIITLKLEFSP